MTHKIHLRLGCGDDVVEVVDVDKNWDTTDDCTLKDIAIILTVCCGVGVMKLLSRELAKRLNIDNFETWRALDGIVSEYEIMDDKEAHMRTYRQST